MLFPLRCACATLLLLGAAAATGAEFTGYLSVTTDYVKRGVSQSAGDPAAQLGVDVAFSNGLFAGFWGSTIDIDNGPSRHRDKETNYYVGFARDLANLWRVTGHIVAYRYPGQTGNVDYNYDEYSVGVSYNDRIWLEYSHTPDLYNTGLSAWNADLYTEWFETGPWAVGGGGGYYDTSNLTNRTYWYWSMGATGSFKYADVDVRFHDTSRPVPIISTQERADSRAVLTIRIPF